MSGPEDDGRAEVARRYPATLCASCRHLRVVRSSRESLFLRCALAASDPRMRKYPPQPVVACPGHER